MKWNVRTLFTEEREKLVIQDTLDLSGMEWSGEYPFAKPVIVSGTVTGAGGIVVLRCTVEYTFEGSCDRCLARFSRGGKLETEHLLILSDEDSEDENAILLDDSYLLDLDDVIQADLWLEMPMKSLCKPDCKGLCHQCGQDLNAGACSCSGKEVDPRLAALRQFLTND
ncbi:MAG: DUF177 domain-containing protein [Clostridia bacterium]|nr:DUF177 domain-containing protein [Clostridia bacterium]